MIRQVLCIILIGTVVSSIIAQETVPPIKNVGIGSHGAIFINDKPFFPIMSWLQSTERYPQLRACGINTFMGNYQKKPSVTKMAEIAKAAGGYAIAHYDPTGKDHPYLLGFLHGDEPDILHDVSDAKVNPGKGIKLNIKAPLWRVLDGVYHSWSVLDPLKDASFTIELSKPVTIKTLGIAIIKSNGLSLPSEVEFVGDGKVLLKTTVAAKKGMQKFKLSVPATFSKLEVCITGVTQGKNEWGAIGEIAGFDAADKNVLRVIPQRRPRHSPEEIAARYKKMKLEVPNRLIFMTLTGSFLSKYAKMSKIPEEFRTSAYPKYPAGTDVIGFDIYPIFGWSRPDWLIDIAEGTKELRRLAGPNKPLYAWIEVHKGTSNIKYADQKDVLPKHTRAEVWMAVIQGATGIGYFTHAWRPKFNEFSPTKEMQAELKRINTQLTQLTPAILAAPAKIKVTINIKGAVPGHLKATQLNGILYIFAQNISMDGKAGQATIFVEGIKPGVKIDVLNEERTIQAGVGSFVDSFDALQEHIYRIPME